MSLPGYVAVVPKEVMICLSKPPSPPFVRAQWLMMESPLSSHRRSALSKVSLRLACLLKAKSLVGFSPDYFSLVVLDIIPEIG